jgi:hypothetical protein
MQYILEAIGTLTRPIMRWVLSNMVVNAFEIDYTGSANAISVTKRAGTAGQVSSCLNLTSQNKHFSAIQIRGRELAHGTAKITHEYIGEDDSSASAVSIHVEGADSQAKGIFLKFDGSTGLAHQEVFNGESTPQEGFGWSKNAQEIYMRNSVGARVKLTVTNNQLVISNI